MKINKSVTNPGFMKNDKYIPTLDERTMSEEETNSQVVVMCEKPKVLRTTSVEFAVSKPLYRASSLAIMEIGHNSRTISVDKHEPKGI